MNVVKLNVMLRVVAPFFIFYFIFVGTLSISLNKPLSKSLVTWHGQIKAILNNTHERQREILKRKGEGGRYKVEILTLSISKVVLIRFIYLFVNKARGGGSPKFFTHTL
jgi:hypothetical protein